MLEITAAPPSARVPHDEMELAYRNHASAVERHALALTRDPAAAEDVVQEAFVRLAAELRAGRPPDNVGAWLHRVASNLVTSRGRRLQVAAKFLPALASGAVEESPERRVIDGERSRQLRAALEALPADGRRAVLLAAHGFGGPEIAGILGRTDGATRTLLCRTRSRLRAELIEAGAD